MSKQKDDRQRSISPPDIAQAFKQLLVKFNTNAYRIAKETGIDKTYLSKLSSGAIAKPGEDKLVKIAQALDIEPEKLLTVFTDPEIAMQEFGLAGIDLEQPIVNRRQDWGTAPDGIICYNRVEIETIRQWIEVKRSRIVNIFGLGGIGKTTLAMEVARQVEGSFDYVFWRSLSRVSLIEMVLQDALRLFEPNRQNNAATISQQIARLIHYLRTHRCLLVFDCIEIVLATGSSLKGYQNGYEHYGELFRQIAESNHQSCLILVGTEKPKDIAVWSSSTAAICSLQVKGASDVALQILKDKQLPPSPAWNDLIEAYQGHPLALKIVATMIWELFRGDVAEFLRHNTLFLGDLEFVLHQQYRRLSVAEREILDLVAQASEPLSLVQLRQQLAIQVPHSKVMSYLGTLRRRSLLETKLVNDVNFYSLQPIVQKYINSHT